MSEPRHIVFLTTDFRPMVGGVADHLHRMADHLAARTPVTVMTTVPVAGASWPHAYRLVSLDPLPDRRLGQLPGDNLPPLRKLRTGAHFLALRRYADRLLADIKAAIRQRRGRGDRHLGHGFALLVRRVSSRGRAVLHRRSRRRIAHGPVRPPAALEATRFRAVGPRHRQQPSHGSPHGGYVSRWPFRRPS